MDAENAVAATWDPEVRAGYIYVNPTGKRHGYTQIAEGVIMLDLDEQGDIIGIEILL